MIFVLSRRTDMSYMSPEAMGAYYGSPSTRIMTSSFIYSTLDTLPRWRISVGGGRGGGGFRHRISLVEFGMFSCPPWLEHTLATRWVFSPTPGVSPAFDLLSPFCGTVIFPLKLGSTKSSFFVLAFHRTSLSICEDR